MYVAGSVKIWLIVWQGVKAKAHYVKDTANEVCVPKHNLIVMDMRFNTTKRWCKKFEPRVCVWKLKDEKSKSMVRDKVGRSVEIL